MLCEPFPNIADLTGKLSLDELIAFIQSADGLIAGSTGPLHIAAAMGINALGLFTPLIGHNPARWKPLGMKAEYLVSEKKNCYGCKKTQQCPCIKEIMPEQVINRIQAWRHEKSLSRLSV